MKREFVCKTHGPIPEPRTWADPKTGWLHRWCPLCVRERQPGRTKYMSEWRRKNAERRALYGKEWNAKYHAEVIAERKAKRKALVAEILVEYGGRCQCCHEDNPGFLTVDHVNNDGKKHRKEDKGASAIYAWLKKNGFPRDGFQLLCFNCNLGKQRNGGICPHSIVLKKEN